MPVNVELASKNWYRYCYIRDNAHLDYVRKAYKCEDFFAGLQWEKADLAMLRQQRRPALTINKIISTLSNVMGEQIFNRTQISFRPRNEGATGEVADVLTKVFMQISDNNQLDWLRSDMFADGIVGSRGYLNVELDFSDNLRGEVRIKQLNPKNVMVDPDAEDYDPDTWDDVLITKWLNCNDVALMYSTKDAEYLKGYGDSYFPYGHDSIDITRDRFGLPRSQMTGYDTFLDRTISRHIRVIDRQYKQLSKIEYFVDIERGDMRPVDEAWDYNRISEYLQQNPGLTTMKRQAKRIRWTVTAENCVLHDDWSPYKHFTVVPFFPYFRRGRTIGLVENLLGPQEMLNKISSQELHVVNTTANSGWKLKKGSLQNMTAGELENRGATTGLVLELDEINNAEKITPNQTPSGLDRLSYKSEEHIKTISGVSDYQTGNAREDVSAKAVKLNQSRGSANFAKVMDNLNRTDHILARNVLDLVQGYYTEPRIMQIVTDKLTNQTQQLQVNQIDPVTAAITNDLTLGEYSVVVSNQPERDTFEDTQFDQLVAMRTEMGVQIPDKYVIMASRLRDKAQIVEEMSGNQNSPEAQAAAALKKRADEAGVAKLEAEAQEKQAKSLKERATAAKTQSEIGKDDGQAELVKLQQEHALKAEQMDREFALEKEKMDREFALKQEQLRQDMEIKRQAAADKALTDRAAAVQKAKAPQPKPGASQ